MSEFQMHSKYTGGVTSVLVSLSLVTMMMAATAAAADQQTASASNASNAASRATKTFETVAVRSSKDGSYLTADGVVEAVKTAELAPQVAGAIQQILVQAGDRIKQGQVLARIDARAAQQELAASRANIDMVKANLALAEKDFERQKSLFEKNYISQAQLDRAAAALKVTAAQANAQIAQASAVQTQNSFYTLVAPFDGYVAAMPSAPGQMAMPGKPVMTVYDPRWLRVIVSVPQARLASLNSREDLRLEFPSLPIAERFLKPKAMTVLPISDAATHTVQIRFDLENPPKSVVPGLFARINLKFDSATTSSTAADAHMDILNQRSLARLYVPSTALIKRAELYGVYVINQQGQAVLRQVKPGPVLGTEQEILSGLNAGDKVVREALSVFAAQ